MAAHKLGKTTHSRFLTIVALLVVSTVIMAATVSAAFVISDRSVSITLTGVVTDSVCGMDHGIKAAGDAECTRTCVVLGAEYALARGKKVYVLQGHEMDLERFAGSEVRVKGRTAGTGKVIVEQVDRLYTEAAATQN